MSLYYGGFEPALLEIIVFVNLCSYIEGLVIGLSHMKVPSMKTQMMEESLYLWGSGKLSQKRGT